MKGHTMRHQYRWLLIAGLSALLIGGCKKDDGAVGTEDAVVLTADDAADTFASTLGGSQSTAGLTAQLEEAATIAGGGSLGKVDASAGTMWDTTITRVRVGTYSYSYSFRYSVVLANVNRLDFGYTMKGIYDTPRMSSNDSAAASFQVSNLLTGTAYSVTGIYNRYGSQASKVRNKVSFTSTITVSTTALLIDKSTKRVSGGSAAVIIYGQSSTGNIYSFNGTVTFLGNQQATLVIGSKSYTINLATGEATAA
ncbi:MAG: hypothetical protein IPI01_07180 [Ignavibacteriae bacterium]|nr:hypothetical protein [Ignavibacteriota bacterium]